MRTVPDRCLKLPMKTLTTVIYPGETGRWLVAYNPETGSTTQGRTLKQANVTAEEFIENL
jgi:predicted RNase H-like HicB family nuclease